MTTKKLLIILWAVITVQLILLSVIKEQNIQDLIKLKDAYAMEASSAKIYYSAFCVEDKNGVIACMYSEDKSDYDRLQNGEKPINLQGEIIK